MKKASVINLLAFNGGWFACILGAANGLPWLGVLAVFVLTAAHLAYHRFDRNIVILYALAFLIGVIADGALVASGVLSFPDHAKLLTPLALWMPCMWINFATSLNLSLSFLRGRYLIGAFFGLIGAPGTYFAGMSLGAVELSEPFSFSLAAVALEWAIAMPLLLLVASRFTPSEPSHGTESS